MKIVEVKTVNSMKHRINTKDADGNDLQIDIRLGDYSHGHNGHADFAITCTAWEKGKPHTDKYFLYAGCSHDEILKVRPDLKVFVDLHLSDQYGAPMYTVENGFYHLKNSSLDVAREYIRASREQIELLKTCEDSTYYAFMLEKMGLPEQWQKEASQAIELLEQWTGLKFELEPKRRNFSPLGAKAKEVERKLKAGYYSPEKIQERVEQNEINRRQKLIAEFEEHRDNIIANETLECEIKTAIVNAGLPHDNFIYYNHSGEGVFNWQDSTSYRSSVTEEQVKQFLSVLPDSLAKRGIIWKIGKKVVTAN